MANLRLDQGAIDGFINSLAKWGRTLSKSERGLLDRVVREARHRNLSVDALKSVVGGMRKDDDGGFWAQWSQRQY